MSRQSLLVFALLAALGIVSISLWLELRQERLNTANLSAQIADLTAAAAIAPAAHPIKAASASIAEQVALACDRDPSPAALPSEEFIARMESLVTRIPVTIAGFSNEANLLADPEYRSARLTQMRISEAKDNPGLAEALNLSDSEARSLFELMAEGQLRVASEISQSPDGRPALPALIDIAQRNGASREDAVRSLLGEPRYAEFLAYSRDVRPAYIQAASIVSTLNSAGQPLGEAQSQALKSALLAEQRRARSPQTTLPASHDPNARPIERVLAGARTRQEDGNRQILEAATPYLSTTQIEVLRKHFEQQAALSRP